MLLQNKELLRQLKNPSSLDSCLTTLTDDIIELQKMFRMCSFELARENIMTECNSLSSYALGITVDEEWYFPQCNWELVVKSLEPLLAYVQFL